MRMDCGNPQAIDLFETYAARAKEQDQYRFAVVALAKPSPGMMKDGELAPDATIDLQIDYAGDPYLQPFGPTITEQIGDMFMRALANRERPPRDPRLGSDYWCWNVADDPQSFDFVNCLVNAEMDRIRDGAPAPLKVGFWPGYHPLAGMHVERRKHWLDHVQRPLIKLIGAIETPQACHGCHYDNAWDCYRTIVQRAKAGEPVPKFRAPPEYLDKVKQFVGCVTITLREVDPKGGNCPERNSQIGEWVKFGDWLEQHGERVIFIRDTLHCMEPIPGFRTCPAASVDLLARAALYEVAKANCFISNGPVMLAMFGDKPLFVTVEIRDDSLAPYWPNTARSWRENIGVQVGEQFPWSTPNQRIVWAEDSFENLVRGWREIS